MTSSDSLQETLKSVVEFVGMDTETFSVEKFLTKWPTTAEDQRVILAMLVVRTSREVGKLSASLARAWWIITGAAIGSTLALALIVNIDPVAAFVTALVAGGMAQLVEILYV